jgi:hypothetical protein
MTATTATATATCADIDLAVTPAECPECGAPAGVACTDPFCPGSDGTDDVAADLAAHLRTVHGRDITEDEEHDLAGLRAMHQDGAQDAPSAP